MYNKDAPRRCVYIIRSRKEPDRQYIGRTADVASRLASHNAGESPRTARQAPWQIVVLVQLLLTVALALVFSALTVHFRDIKDLLGNLLTFWFFATPIIYPMSAAPEPQRRLLNVNPFTHLAISYQEILFYKGPFGHWKWLLALLVASMGLFLLGYFLFDRLRDSFAEEV